jgi:hypothetical protein
MRAALLLFALLCACGGEPAFEASAGEAVLELVQVPANVSCLKITFTGATRTRSLALDAVAGARSSWTLSALPTGEVVITADGFSAPCPSIAGIQRTWFSAPLVAQILPDTPATLTILMYR